MASTKLPDNLHTNKVDSNAALVIIYCKETNHRLVYTLNFIFESVLNCRYHLVNDVTVFLNNKGPKINYSNETLAGLQIYPEGLLNETGIRTDKPKGTKRGTQLYFFHSPTHSNGYHFDVFAAVFYFIGRYEEWQPFKPDKHQRFEASESLLFQNAVHLTPLVDEWIRELGSELGKQNPGFSIPRPRFSVISTVDVDNLFAYRAKGVWRTAGAMARDLIQFNIKHSVERVQVLLGYKKDPFDVYEELAELANKNEIPLFFFFLCRNGNAYDRAASPGSSAFKMVIQLLVRQGAHLGLHPSYYTVLKENLLQEELQILNASAGYSITASRNHFLRFNIRLTPHLLLKNGISTDFSMGFASRPGFRAGTAHPFSYFDLSQNKSFPLTFVPFCAMDGAYLIYDNKNTNEALTSMLEMAKSVKKNGGVFATVFHESTFSDHLYKGFGTLYKKLHEELKQLSLT